MTSSNLQEYEKFLSEKVSDFLNLSVLHGAEFEIQTPSQSDFEEFTDKRFQNIHDVLERIELPLELRQEPRWSKLLENRFPEEIWTPVRDMAKHCDIYV